MNTHQPGLVNVGEVLSQVLGGPGRPHCPANQLSLCNVAAPTVIAPPPFEELHTSPLAGEARRASCEYDYLVQMRSRAREPQNGSQIALKMRVVDGLTVDEIASKLNKQVGTVAAAISSVLRKIMDDIGVPDDVKLRRHLVDSLNRYEVHQNLYPWHAWFDLWKRYPADVALPPRISGLLHEEIWEPMGLGTNQADRGQVPVAASRAGKRGLPKLAERARFTVEPFIEKGFFGLRITKELTQSDPVEFSRTLAIGVHDKLIELGCKGSVAQPCGEKKQFCPATTHEEFPINGKSEAYLLKLPSREAPQERIFRDAYGSRGALTALSFGYGPIELTELFATRTIYTRAVSCADGSRSSASTHYPVFSEGITEETPATLQFPVAVINEGYTGYTIGFPKEALGILMRNGTLKGARLPVHVHMVHDGGCGQTPEVPPRRISKHFGEMEFQEVSLRRIDFCLKPFGQWHNTNLMWVRVNEIIPTLKEILAGGEASLPHIDPLTVPKNKRLPFAGHYFTIPPGYQGAQITLEFYVAKPGVDGASQVLAAFRPLRRVHSSSGHHQKQDNTPVVVYATPVGKQDAAVARTWRAMPTGEWQRLLAQGSLERRSA